MQRHHRPLLLTAALVFGGIIQAETACAQTAGGPAATEPPSLAADVIDAGREIFHTTGTCHACHGEQLQGGPVAPSLHGPKWRHIDGTFGAMLRRVQNGQDGTLMVAFPGDITPAQSIQVATYVWAVSQGKTKP